MKDTKAIDCVTVPMFVIMIYYQYETRTVATGTGTVFFQLNDEMSNLYSYASGLLNIFRGYIDVSERLLLLSDKYLSYENNEVINKFIKPNGFYPATKMRKSDVKLERILYLTHGNTPMKLKPFRTQHGFTGINYFLFSVQKHNPIRCAKSI